MTDDRPTDDQPIWSAYGPAKDAWKAEPGNYYTAEELAHMAAEFDDLTITPPLPIIYDAN